MLLTAFVVAVMATVSGASPGTCDFNQQLYLAVCQNFTSADELAVSLNKSSFKYFEELYLRSVSLDFIRFDTFMNDTYTMKNIYIENSRLGDLTDRGRAFMGLESYLVMLSFTESTFQNKWDWGIFNKMENLKRINITNCNLSVSGIENFQVEDMGLIVLNNSGISELPSRAFAGLPKLVNLKVINNKIRVVERSMFPAATRLAILDLSNNSIEMIPEDLFQNMSTLEWLFLSGNKLLTLKEHTFSPVYKPLSIFRAENNDFLCDFNLCWMIQKLYLYDTFVATCQGPSYLRGRNITSLRIEELYC